MDPVSEMRDEIKLAVETKCYDARDLDACINEVYGRVQKSEEVLEKSEEINEKLRELKNFIIQMINQF